MYSKVINSVRNRREAPYSNKGSSQRMVNYLKQEADLDSKEPIYFSHDNKVYKSQEVVSTIDNNNKGIRKEASKFYSIVIAPSPEELRHINNDKKKLEEYTKATMDNYARNFNLPNDEKLTGKDLVWFATIHHNRVVKDNDPYLKDKTKGIGELKDGDNTHIHIVVSRNDKNQKYSLSPETKQKGRFHRMDWFKENCHTFNQMFGYKKSQQYLLDYRAKSIEKRIGRMVKKYGLNEQYLNKNKVGAIGERKDYNAEFYRNLNILEKRFKSGDFPKDAHHFIEHGKDPQVKDLDVGKEVKNVLKQFKNADPDFDNLDFELEQLRNKAKRRLRRGGNQQSR